MFDAVLLFAIPLLAGLAVLMILGAPYVFSETSNEGDGEASWRDPAPGLFRLVLPIAQLYAGRARRRLGNQQRGLLERRLDAAGIGFAVTPDEFRAIQWLMTVIGAGLGALAISHFGYSSTWILVAIALPSLAYFYPYVWLRDAIHKRQARIEKDFPFFMDVLALSMRAGLTFQAAVQQATAQLPDGPVRGEFIRFLRQTRTGVSRREALDRLAARIQIVGVSNFVAAVNQAEETGGALSDVLAGQAEQRRQERFNKAEKKANQAPVKMLFPLVALLFPITFVIVMFPIVVQLLDSGAVDFLQ
jgi:tight adherence protein C